MYATAKLLKRMPRRDKERILEVLAQLQAGTLSGIKLKDREQYRVRVGSYRILFHFEPIGPVIDQVRRRNERT